MKVQFGGAPHSLSPTKLQPRSEPQRSFQDYLKDALAEVNQLQQQGDVAFAKLLTGEIEFHEAMIMAEKANLALQLTMAIRTKLIEAYQEIMRMQV
ncbi:MAG: flagellar hook-basal body complex protein FliE [Limnochordia bacterium]|mgnify:CR=1 FL=1|jgi:flagellar hook-basal body complex protein FliE|nr:flagellar hook-basal body complex protein FliE [Bacillota bacterium]NLL08037.1 flagellar hook-basal body complex protein FliE [Bacillota bacterium]HBG09966.1 flagellar hook-basal body complex protein FliE [Bacillota bacterium]